MKKLVTYTALSLSLGLGFISTGADIAQAVAKPTTTVAAASTISRAQAFTIIKKTKASFSKVGYNPRSLAELKKIFPYVSSSYLPSFLHATLAKKGSGWALCECDSTLYIAISYTNKTKIKYSKSKRTAYVSEYIVDEMRGNHVQTITLSKTSAGWKITNIKEKYD